MELLSQKTVILGAGLLGGSLGMALKRRGVAKSVHAWSPSESTREACLSSDWCDEVHQTPASACSRADLIFLCAPVDKISPLMAEISPACEAGALITDVGSTKARISEAGEQFFPPEHAADFIGSHPMAGSEKSGLSHADADLFQGKTCIITPVNSLQEPLERLRRIWQALGMEIFECSPEEHDQIVAHVSHLPHGLAAALCASLADLPQKWRFCAGPGLRDTSRIAAGDPELWTAIFRENEPAFRESLRRMQESLSTLESTLDAPDDGPLLQFLEKAREYRLTLDHTMPPHG